MTQQPVLGPGLGGQAYGCFPTPLLEARLGVGGGCCSLPAPASALLGVSGKQQQQQHLGGEPTHPPLARRPVALERLGPSLGVQKETPLLAFKRTQSQEELLFVPGSSMPCLCLLGLPTH